MVGMYCNDSCSSFPMRIMAIYLKNRDKGNTQTIQGLWDIGSSLTLIPTEQN